MFLSDFRSKATIALSATLPAMAIGAFLATAPPRAQAECQTGCYAGGYYSCGYCLQNACDTAPRQKCVNNSWTCGCG